MNDDSCVECGALATTNRRVCRTCWVVLTIATGMQTVAEWCAWAVIGGAAILFVHSLGLGFATGQMSEGMRHFARWVLFGGVVGIVLVFGSAALQGSRVRRKKRRRE